MIITANRRSFTFPSSLYWKMAPVNLTNPLQTVCVQEKPSKKNLNTMRWSRVVRVGLVDTDRVLCQSELGSRHLKTGKEGLCPDATWSL